MKRLITTLLTILTITPTWAANCRSSLENPCSLSFQYKGQSVIMDAGVFKDPCAVMEGQKNLNRCMVARLCPQSKNAKRQKQVAVIGDILHDIKAHLKSLCFTENKLLDIDSKHYISVTCNKKKTKATMNFVAGSKKKSCPLPFKMP